MVSIKLVQEKQCHKMHFFVIAALISSTLVFILVVSLSSEAYNSVSFLSIVIIFISISKLKLFF